MKNMQRMEHWSNIGNIYKCFTRMYVNISNKGSMNMDFFDISIKRHIWSSIERYDNEENALTPKIMIF